MTTATKSGLRSLRALSFRPVEPRMARFWRTFVSVYCMTRNALVLTFMATASFAATYSVVPIPAPSGFTVAAMSGINDSGQVAMYADAGTVTLAFIGTPSGSTMIPLPSGWSRSFGTAVSPTGKVAGFAYNGAQQQAFIGSTAGSTVIPLPINWFVPANLIQATGSGVNDSGLVVGTVSNVNNGNQSQAFIWHCRRKHFDPLAFWMDLFRGQFCERVRPSGR
jgi:hypothetical protein